jgi:tRNA 5-methylaminomethyl-2-thiouridine biosynthesis bifunctional protein
MTTDTFTIAWRNGQPYSNTFDDVYFSSDDGLAETQYVFIDGNQLQQRWTNLSAQDFHIIETGFGTGLNCMCAANLWLKLAPPQAVLHITSIEKYPLSLPDMQQALAMWPDLTALTPQFLAQYTHLKAGLNVLDLAQGRVKLELWIGDVVQVLPKLNQGCDAWFLDGFAPAKNPEMWQPALFTHMARLSKPSTTFATFTSASAVRKGLQATGFSVHKKAGFGRKREMLYGEMAT